MQIPVKRPPERIPGGIVLVPLLAGAGINTFLRTSPEFLRSCTGALFTGAMPERV